MLPSKEPVNLFRIPSFQCSIDSPMSPIMTPGSFAQHVKHFSQPDILNSIAEDQINSSLVKEHSVDSGNGKSKKKVLVLDSIDHQASFKGLKYSSRRPSLSNISINNSKGSIAGSPQRTQQIISHLHLLNNRKAVDRKSLKFSFHHQSLPSLYNLSSKSPPAKAPKKKIGESATYNYISHGSQLLDIEAEKRLLNSETNISDEKSRLLPQKLLLPDSISFKNTPDISPKSKIFTRGSTETKKTGNLKNMDFRHIGANSSELKLEDIKKISLSFLRNYFKLLDIEKAHPRQLVTDLLPNLEGFPEVIVVLLEKGNLKPNRNLSLFFFIELFRLKTRGFSPKKVTTEKDLYAEDGLPIIEPGSRRFIDTMESIRYCAKHISNIDKFFKDLLKVELVFEELFEKKKFKNVDLLRSEAINLNSRLKQKQQEYFDEVQRREGYNQSKVNDIIEATNRTNATLRSFFKMPQSTISEKIDSFEFKNGNMKFIGKMPRKLQKKSDYMQISLAQS